MPRMTTSRNPQTTGNTSLYIECDLNIEQTRTIYICKSHIPNFLITEQNLTLSKSITTLRLIMDPAKLRRLITTFSVALIAGAGALAGASLKDDAEVREARRQASEQSVEEKIARYLLTVLWVEG